MYLRALNNGLLVLDPGVEFLSIDNLPTIVTVNNSCQICYIADCVEDESDTDK